RIEKPDGRMNGRYHPGNGGAGVIIYVMDTGVMANHVELSGRVIAGYDVTASIAVGASHCESNNKALEPCFENLEELAGSSHGTSVASLAAGRQVGVAPAAKIVSIRVMNEATLAT